MNPVIKARWQAALRDPSIKQGKGQLESADGEQCCLGVLCNLAVADGVIEKRRADGLSDNEVPFEFGSGDNWQGGLLPEAVIEWAGLGNNIGGDNPIVTTQWDGKADYKAGLAHCNDQLGMKFPQIAELVEQL